MPSKLFDPYRALGIVASDVPFVVNSLGTQSFISVPVNNAFQVYKCDKLTLSLVSSQAHGDISAIAVSRDLTYTSIGTDIIVWKRTNQVKTLDQKHLAPIKHLLIFGTELLSIDQDANLVGWDLKSNKCTFAIQLDKNKMSNPTVLLHPPTYLNKVIISSEKGYTQLWNIRSRKMVYEFHQLNGVVARTMAISPVIDVVAIGTAKGSILVHNLKTDTTLMKFQHETPITALSFRSDSQSAGSDPMLTAGDESGQIIIWNLKERQMQNSIDIAHESSVISLAFLPGQPVLVSSGADNALRMWLFDSVDNTPRLLKQRSGHKAPPRRIKYYGGVVTATASEGADGTSAQILSGGCDQAFRVFHTVREQQNVELSQGKLERNAKKRKLKSADVLKLPAIVDFDAGEARARDWNNIVTIHEKCNTAYTWSFENRAIGKHRLSPPTMYSSASEGGVMVERATSVCMSPCGNFGLVGHNTGRIFKYNIQSGLFNGSYPFEGKAATILKSKAMRVYSAPAIPAGTGGHIASVTGLVVGALNDTLVSVGLDANLKFWNFDEGKLIKSVQLPSPIGQLVQHRDSGLLALVCDDGVVRVFDTSTFKLVRRFSGHEGNAITDVAFSADARWIVTAGLDSTLKVWDLPSGHCIDWVVFDSVVTGVTFSPTSEFIATSHANSVGIYLWANKSYFGNVFLDEKVTKPSRMVLPRTAFIESGAIDSEPIDNTSSSTTTITTITTTNTTAVDQGTDTLEEHDNLPLCDGVITLSNLPRGKWNTLNALEMIRERNKPIEAPKAPEKAPFFLKQLPGLTEAWAPVEAAKDSKENGNKETRIMKNFGDRRRCRLHELLKADINIDGNNSSECSGTEEVDSEADDDIDQVDASDTIIMKYLMSLSPSGIDFQFRNLCFGLSDTDGLRDIELILELLLRQMKSCRYFEVNQAYLGLLLKLHGDTMASTSYLKVKLKALESKHLNSWSKLQDIFNHSLCMIKLFTDIQS